MEQIIQNMVTQAEQEENYSLIEYTSQIVKELAETVNAPSNWRSIGEQTAKKYDCNSWVYEEMEFWNYEGSREDFEVIICINLNGIIKKSKTKKVLSSLL